MNTPAAGEALADQALMDGQSEPDMAAQDSGGVTVPRFDPSVPSPARMYDYYLGGKDNFAADREAAEQALSVVPFGREVARANRQFLVRAVTFMARDGIDQFIDLGTGLPTGPNVHEVARSVHPDARVLYVDNDPMVCSHARALLATGNSVAAIQGDIRTPRPSWTTRSPARSSISLGQSACCSWPCCTS